jgi:outer membrane PBP1 activator LpoA protein
MCFVSCASQSVDSRREALLTLSYTAFDQTEGEGWRALLNDQQYTEAAVLIEGYLKRHQNLTAMQTFMLHFHAAQLYATDRENRKAITHLRQASFKDAPRGSNEYAQATVAFLQRDRGTLLAIKAYLAQEPDTEDIANYRRMVNILVEWYDEGYPAMIEYLGKQNR